MASTVSTTNAEVLISLGGSQYIVKVDHAIPAGEIHIGRFAALDALVEATGHVEVPVVRKPGVRILNGSNYDDTGRVKKIRGMLKIRTDEIAAIREWLHANGQTLHNELERRVMAASFPPNMIGMNGSAKVAEAVQVGPAVVRRIRNTVMRRAGILQR
jgi:hypothetical protein